LDTLYNDTDRRQKLSKIQQKHLLVQVHASSCVCQSERRTLNTNVVAAYNSIFYQTFPLNIINFCLFVQRLYNKNHGVQQLCLTVYNRRDTDYSAKQSRRTKPVEVFASMRELRVTCLQNGMLHRRC